VVGPQATDADDDAEHERLVHWSLLTCAGDYRGRLYQSQTRKAVAATPTPALP
jgi:hypothetical protein